jgi:hypothetical protein
MPGDRNRPGQGGSETTTATDVNYLLEPATRENDRSPLRWPYDEDLFGEASIPGNEGIPRKNSRDYLAYIDSLPLPDGLRFWSLAEPPPKGSPPFVESIWCTDRQRRHRRLLVDLRTGQQYDPEPESLDSKASRS